METNDKTLLEQKEYDVTVQGNASELRNMLTTYTNEVENLIEMLEKYKILRSTGEKLKNLNDNSSFSSPNLNFSQPQHIISGNYSQSPGKEHISQKEHSSPTLPPPLHYESQTSEAQSSTWSYSNQVHTTHQPGFLNDSFQPSINQINQNQTPGTQRLTTHPETYIARLQGLIQRFQTLQSYPVMQSHLPDCQHQGNTEKPQSYELTQNYKITPSSSTENVNPATYLKSPLSKSQNVETMTKDSSPATHHPDPVKINFSNYQPPSLVEQNIPIEKQPTVPLGQYPFYTINNLRTYYPATSYSPIKNVSSSKTERTTSPDTNLPSIIVQNLSVGDQQSRITGQDSIRVSRPVDPKEHHFPDGFMQLRPKEQQMFLLAKQISELGEFSFQKLPSSEKQSLPSKNDHPNMYEQNPMLGYKLHNKTSQNVSFKIEQLDQQHKLLTLGNYQYNDEKQLLPAGVGVATAQPRQYTHTTLHQPFHMEQRNQHKPWPSRLQTQYLPIEGEQKQVNWNYKPTSQSETYILNSNIDNSLSHHLNRIHSTSSIQDVKQVKEAIANIEMYLDEMISKIS